jgi:hypothetical protein
MEHSYKLVFDESFESKNGVISLPSWRDKLLQRQSSSIITLDSLRRNPSTAILRKRNTSSSSSSSKTASMDVSDDVITVGGSKAAKTKSKSRPKEKKNTASKKAPNSNSNTNDSDEKSNEYKYTTLAEIKQIDTVNIYGNSIGHPLLSVSVLSHTYMCYSCGHS